MRYQVHARSVLSKMTNREILMKICGIIVEILDRFIFCEHLGGKKERKISLDRVHRLFCYILDMSGLARY